jgi:hypothetical protein
LSFARVAALVVVVLSVTAGDASGQGIRDGFWLEVTGGQGTVRNTCAGCPGVTVGFGSTTALRVGGALNRRVLVGVEVLSLESPRVTLRPGVSPVEAENLSLVPVVLWYVGGSGFFLKAGAGLARGSYTISSGAGSGQTTSKTGSGMTFAVGFDVPIMRWFAFTANLGTYVTAIGDVVVNGDLVDDVIATVYEAGFGITLR